MRCCRGGWEPQLGLAALLHPTDRPQQEERPTLTTCTNQRCRIEPSLSLLEGTKVSEQPCGTSGLKGAPEKAPCSSKC